jgi:hypothetical protein
MTAVCAVVKSALQVLRLRVSAPCQSDPTCHFLIFCGGHPLPTTVIRAAYSTLSTMARKKVDKKQQSTTSTTVVTHRAVDLHSLMERAKTGESAAVRAYLDAGGSPTVLVDFTNS